MTPFKGGSAMTDRTVAPGQLRTVVLLALFTLGTEGLPDRLAVAGPAAWLCPLGAGVIAVALAALVSRRPVLGQGALGESFRPGVRLGLTGVYLLWGLVLTTAHAVRIGLRLSDSLRAYPALLTAAVLLLAGWMAVGGLPALSRACEIFALAIGFAFFLIVLFGVFGLRWDHVILWDIGTLAAIPRGMGTTLGTAAAGVFALFLIEDVRPEKGARVKTLRQLGELFLWLALATLLVLGRLGPGLSGQIDRPFFQMVSGLGFQGAFQRLEEMVSALWLLGDLALLALLLLCLLRLLARTVGRRETKVMGWGLAAAVFGLSLAQDAWSRFLTGPLLSAGNLAAGALLLLVFVVQQEKIKKIKKGG